MKRYRTLPFFIAGNLFLFSMPLWAIGGPIRNPDRIDHYELTQTDIAVLVWVASIGIRHDELGLTQNDIRESIAVLRGGGFIHESNGTISRKGWIALARRE